MQEYSVSLYNSWNFLKISLESKTSLTTFSIQILIFLKIQAVKISFLKAKSLKLGHFDIFSMLFPFLVFFKTVKHVAAKDLLTLGYKINYFLHTFLHKAIPCTERISIGLHVSIQHAISALVGRRDGSVRTRTKTTLTPP